MKHSKCPTCGSKVMAVGEITKFYEPLKTIGFTKVYQNYYVDQNKFIYKQHPAGFMEYVHTVNELPYEVNELPYEVLTKLKEFWKE